MAKPNLRDALRTETKNNIEGTSGFKKSYLNTDGVTLYRPQEDKQLLDIIPFIVKTDNFPRKKKGDIVYIMGVTEHKNVGINNTTELCLKGTFGRACPICEEREILKATGASDDELITAFPMSWRAFYNVLDRGDEAKGIQIWDVAFNWIEKILRADAERLAQKAGPNEDGELDYIIFADLEDGRHIEYTGKSKSFNNNSYIQPEGLGFVKRDESVSESWMEKAISLETLLIIPTYEELKRLYFAIEEEIDTPKQPEQPKQLAPAETKNEKIKRALEIKNKAKQKDTDNLCPHAHIFGEEFDEYEQCGTCKKLSECADAFCQ